MRKNPWIYNGIVQRHKLIRDGRGCHVQLAQDQKEPGARLVVRIPDLLVDDYWINAPIREREHYERWVCRVCKKTLRECFKDKEVGGSGPGIVYWHHTKDEGVFNVCDEAVMWDKDAHMDVIESDGGGRISLE